MWTVAILAGIGAALVTIAILVVLDHHRK